MQQGRLQEAKALARKVRRWAIRAVAFYFGFKILHHQVYQVDEVDPLVMALGLWLCGIAPADIFDGLRKLGDRVQTEPGFGATDKRKSSGDTSGDAA